ncbi:hypothetical protein OROGR_023200 [Orobanche gracilis]
MTKPDGVAPEAKDDDVSPSWGTWEELILAFAVNRHGTASWDSIASELRKRTSDPKFSLTARNCRSKYLDLRRRFEVAPGDDFDGGGGKSSVEESAAPLLEELRKLRVAELRREVQRYDLNIESLEVTVKRMEDERDRSLRRENMESDLENKSEEEKMDIHPEVEAESGGELAVGEEMDKDRLSVNESNSTDPGAEKLGTGEKESEPAGTGAEEIGRDRAVQTNKEPTGLESEPDQKSAREGSCNGSSNSIEKSERKGKDEPVTDSIDLAESEAKSDGGEDAAKENSDVQSAASRSRKEEGSDIVRRANASGDECGHKDQSHAVKESFAESQLFEFLQAIRAHKVGSVFERRLRSQETSKYQKLILQHIDLETVETRLKQGWYSRSRIKFFRDLLLLVNNALVFFAKNSSEAIAASEIRTLVSKGLLSHINSKSDSSTGTQMSLQSLSMPMKDEPEEPPHSVMLKPRIPGSLIVCRKRSSIAAKSSDKNKEQNSSEKDSKKPSNNISDEPKITKKRTTDDLFSPTPSANTKNGKSNQPNKNGKGGPASEPKIDNKKSQQMTSDSKKRGVANFLNRMKQGSSSNNGVLVDALKNTPLTSKGNAGGKGGSKNENAKKEENKEHVTKRSTMEAKQTKEKDKGSPGKRNVGRPPKRGPSLPLPPPVAGKRSRERGEMETPSAKQQPKKRARKL